MSELRGKLHQTLNTLSDGGHSIADAVKLGLAEPNEVAALKQVNGKRGGGAIGGAIAAIAPGPHVPRLAPRSPPPSAPLHSHSPQPTLSPGRTGGANGSNMKPENTVDHVEVVCNGCKAESKVPAQQCNGKVQISFRTSLHKKDCEYVGRCLQASVTNMPTPGATKVACNGRLTIKRPMGTPPPMPQPPL